MSDIVWLLWFEQEREEGEGMELLIGVYRTDEAAGDLSKFGARRSFRRQVNEITTLQALRDYFRIGGDTARTRRATSRLERADSPRRDGNRRN
jgi:hypothetical protein